MKNVFGLTLLVWMLISCQKTETRYSQKAPEIDAVMAMYDAYNDGNFDGTREYYHPDAKIYINVPESNPATLDQSLSEMNQDKDMFSNFKITIPEDAIEKVVTDKGETWVNVWGEWKGTLTATGKEYLLPFHQTFQFENGKIVKEYGYWDNGPIVEDLMKAEMAKTDTLSVP